MNRFRLGMNEILIKPIKKINNHFVFSCTIPRLEGLSHKHTVL